MSARTSYLRFELRRTLRNPRFLTFSFGFPLALYWFMAGPNRGEQDFGGSGIAAVVYYMVSMAAWGAMGSMMNGAGRIASERQRGWTRQLRITPLRPAAYLAGKLAVCYVMALLTIAGLTVSALALGGRFDVLDYAAAIGLMCVGMVPFALLAVALGHVLTPDTIGPAIGGVLGLLPIVSGVWFPLPDDGLLHAIGVTLPSYWLVQASHLLVGGSAWGVRGWVTMAIWTVVLARLARGAWRRDSGRV
jgi:ABC-2 type transport system permease protein